MPYVQTDLGIYYRLAGDGPPVLWHTGGCGDGRMWEMGGYLAWMPGFTHIVMDHRGRGRSDAPGDMSGHHMERYVSDVVAVLDDAGFDQAAFVGYSFGARVGFASAVRSPGRLTGLVALDSFPNPEESPDAIRAQAREVLARGTRAVIEELACDELEPPPQWLVEHLCTTHAVAFAGSIEAEATEPDLWAAAPTLDVPVLLVLGRGGDGDPLAERLVREMPHARRVILDVAHLAAFHRTDLTLPLFRPFLESVSARPDVPH